MNQGIILQRGKERPIKDKHHWIFSGAIAKAPNYSNGDILPVYSASGELLGHAMMNKDTSIAARMINFDSTDPVSSIKLNIKRAIKYRQELFRNQNTNAYRLINGEGDNLSGLVIDKYNDVLVVQIVSTGMDKLINEIVSVLTNELDVDCVYEKSTIGARKKEGLPDVERILFGKLPDKVEILENGVKFLVDIKNSQKTGLFLDQREMRKLVGEFAKDRTVLNCFSYTGGFSLYAAINGARKVVSVDIAQDAVNLSKDNFAANKISTDNHEFRAVDAFDYLHNQELNFDFIILDPPAFAKKREDIPNARRGYLDINKTALRKMPSNSFLLTCSCSYHMEQAMFEDLIKQAALETGRKVKIIAKHRLASDHPLNIFHNEMDYLKSLLLYID